MKVSFVDNISRKLNEVLSLTIPNAKELKFAVAFVKISGFLLIAEAIEERLKDGRSVEFLIGLDFRITEPKVLRELKRLSDEGFPLKYYCLSETVSRDFSIYHPKLYLLGDGRDTTIILGSSNLTEGGLKKNVEANVIITASLEDEIASDAYALYSRLKFQKKRFVPDLEYIDKYEEVYERVQKRNVEVLHEKKTKEIIGQLKEKEKCLPKTTATESGLLGWSRLVFEKLPSGRFRTSDMYKYEPEFQEIYPENRNIRAKIRQQLQFLRDIGLIENPRRDTWSKV